MLSSTQDAGLSWRPHTIRKGTALLCRKTHTVSRSLRSSSQEAPSCSRGRPIRDINGLRSRSYSINIASDVLKMQGQYSAGRGGGRYGGGPYGGRGGGGAEQGGRGYGRGGGEYRGGGRGGDSRGGGRGGGRGRGGSSFEDRPIQLQPDREATMGTAARPGTNVHLMGTEESAVTVERQFAGFPKALQAYGMQPRPKRTGFGSVGRTVQLVANHFPVVCQLKQAFHYDVTITSVRRNRPEGEMDTGPGGDKKDEEPRAPAKPLTPELSRRVIEALADQEKWPRVWGYDGRKNIYAATLFLPQHESSFEVETTDGDSPRERLFKVTIKWAQTISISTLLQFISGNLGEEIPQDAVQALDIALKHSMSYRDDVKAFARAIFWRDPTKVRPLGNGAEVWLGYQQSLRPSHAGLTLNMDMAATAFLEPQPVVEYLLRAVGMRSPQDFARLTPQQHRTASKAITGIRIEVRLGGSFQRKYTVKGLMPKGPADLTFYNEQDGKEMSVAAYYEERYHISIKQPQVPCINVGTPTKPVWLPPEVCWIVEGQRRLKLDEKQTAEMIKTAAQRPTERKEYIQKCLRDFAKLPEDPVVQAFKMSVDPNFLKVTGRQLPPPELQYSRNRQPFKVVPQPDRGSWDMRDVKFYRPGEIKCFAVAAFCSQRSAGGPVDDPASIQNFMWEFFKGCSKVGIAVPNMTPVPESLIVWHNPNAHFPGDTMQAAHEAARQHFRQEPDIIFVILPERGQTEIYKSIKRASDSHLGVPSQCFVPKNAGICTPPRRGRDQYIGNVVMKVNAKLSGINTCLISKHVKWMDEPFMVFGADVTHPVGFNQTSPSVAAVVGSLDRQLSCFGSQILLQGHRVELLLDLKSAVKKLMVMFYKKNSVKPRRVIMYRDGVSEGQYPQVQRHEIPQIVKAICELNNCDAKDCDIPVTYIVASKGHHTRLFPATPRDGDKNGNVLPGTVVDKGIVHPTEYDFYLNAHASIQGTSRPVHYHVMLDQNNLGPDALQSFTYDMSYLFCRCTRSVSLVPPCYYAHLAAFRGRILVSESLSDTESSVSSAAGPTNVEFAQTHMKLQNRMFYI